MNLLLQQLNRKIGLWLSELSQEEQKRRAAEESKQQREKQIIQEINNMEMSFVKQINDIMVYGRIAENNSYNKVCADGAIPLKPDIPKLGMLSTRINYNVRSDPNADQVVALCSQHLAWIDEQRMKMEQEIRAKVASMGNQDDSVSDSGSPWHKIYEEADAYFNSVYFKELERRVNEIKDKVTITDKSLYTVGSTETRENMVVGYHAYPINGKNKFHSIFQQYMGINYESESGGYWIPMSVNLNAYREMRIQYTQYGWKSAKEGIWSLLVRLINQMGPEKLKVTVWDEIYYSMELLGPLYALCQGEDPVVEPVPIDDRALRNKIDQLNVYYKQLEQKLGMETVEDYNARVPEKQQIPYRILVMNRSYNQYGKEERPEVAYLLNNAKRLGIFIISFQNMSQEQAIDNRHGQEINADLSSVLWLKDSGTGSFSYITGRGMSHFRFPGCTVTRLPEDYVQDKRIVKEEILVSTKYFDNFSATVPQKSCGVRRPLSIPFAVDDEGNIISCKLEDENFAAYMMGASRSGKSTLLHMMITHVLMNYHPDEVELWLMDFKLTEFARYADWKVPHIKYLLAEDSPELSYDILDKMTEELNRRKRIFARNGWQKQTEVPTDVYMPQIFVIIDEFARFSQYIRDTVGTGYDKDYTLKLENMLAQGAALGFRFIFSSQTYSDGVRGLTETARKQIQNRFALKNTVEEIKSTLSLTNYLVTEEVQKWMNTLPVYESLYKWQDDDGTVHVKKLKNMYTIKSEMADAISRVEEELEGDYRDKKPVLVSGDTPSTFKALVRSYEDYEDEDEEGEFDDGRGIYAGVPRSFYTARPFILEENTGENMLLVGGSRDAQASVVLSVIASYLRDRGRVEIWGDKRNRIWKKCHKRLFDRYRATDDLAEIYDATKELRQEIEDRSARKRLVVVLGYESIRENWENYADDIFQDMCQGNDSREERYSAVGAPATDTNPGEEMDLFALLDSIPENDDELDDKSMAKIQSYNETADATEKKASSNEKIEEQTDLLANMEYCLQKGPVNGVHFLFCFERLEDFEVRKNYYRYFRHRMGFSMGISESKELLGSVIANKLPEGCFAYAGDGKEFSMKPHLHPGLPYDGWMVDEHGRVVMEDL